jgi:drug/metabolite transporter (DMT)-like permease
MPRLSTKQVGFTLLSMSAVGWSTAGFFTRLVAADVLTIVGWRGFFSSIALLAYLLWKHGRSYQDAFRGFAWASWAVATISTLATILYIAALLNTTVAKVAVIEATSPFIASALAWLLIGERAGPWTLVASALAFIGILLTVYDSASGGRLYGDFLALAVTASMALITVISRMYRGISMIPATLVSAVQLTAISFALAHPMSVPIGQIGILALFGVVQAASFAAYIEGARYIASGSAALISAADVPLAPLWVWLAFNEVPPSAAIIGGTAICAAVVLDIVGANRRTGTSVG